VEVCEGVHQMVLLCISSYYERACAVSEYTSPVSPYEEVIVEHQLARQVPNDTSSYVILSMFFSQF